MSNVLQIFNFGLNQIRVVMVNGEPYFVAKDVCDILDIDDTGRAISRLDEDESTRIEIDHPQSPTKKIEVYGINESGLYELIFGSRKKEAKTFKKWVKSEVLPTIRKTGGYVANDELFINTYLPHADESTKMLFKSTLLTVRTQNEKIAILQPKAEKWENYLDAEGFMTMVSVANILADTHKNMGRNLLFEFLRDKQKFKKDNTPMGQLLKMNPVRFKVIDHISPNMHTNRVTLVSTHGFDYISDLVELCYQEWFEARKQNRKKAK